MILLLDNYDSFTYNLAHLLAEHGAEVRVERNDAITADEAEALIDEGTIAGGMVPKVRAALTALT